MLVFDSPAKTRKELQFALATSLKGCTGWSASESTFGENGTLQLDLDLPNEILLASESHGENQLPHMTIMMAIW